MTRPMPPEEALRPAPETFVPDEALREWIFATFISDDGALHNPDHAHLETAEIGALWTNVDNARQMRLVIGQAELMPPMAMGKWQRARAIAQIEAWFGAVPDFLITLHAAAAESMDDASFCALVEHELYHCGQERDQYGAPKFTRDGAPKFAIRGHDVEEFVGVVARYGMTGVVRDLVEVANAGPSIDLADIAGACGTCLRAA